METRILVQAVKRNLERFPADLMFELSAAEWAALRSQSVTSKPGRGGRRYAPYAFTEQGVAMLTSVLNSVRAIAVNIEIMRSFVRIRNCSRPIRPSLEDSSVLSANLHPMTKRLSEFCPRFAS